MGADELLEILADGEYHSGEQLGANAGLTRAAVWKQVRKLARWGLQVEAGSGRGYRLPEPIELLDAQQLRAALNRDERFELERLDVFTETDSTNRFLLNNPPAQANSLRLCFAEWQSAGRGRLTRRWMSPLGSGICASAAWLYEGTPRNFSVLSLAAGAAIAEAVQLHSDVPIQLKWPNDLVCDGRKLGGVLVESRIEAHGLCHVVIGLGVNVSVPDALLAEVSDWQAGAVDLKTALAGSVPSRRSLAADIAVALGVFLSSYERCEPAQWLSSWRRLDYLRDKPVRITTHSDTFDGRAGGIDDDGALMVESESGVMQRVVAGDASVRTQ